MVDVKTDISVKIPGLRRFHNQVKSGGGHIRKAFNQWALRYRSFVQRRFDKFSRGGGDWPDLKYRDGSILRDTNTLFTALAPTLSPPAGTVNNPIEYGVEVGYSGTATHPGGATIPQIAFWHQTGAGNLPVRKIIVPPDAATIRGMVSDMQRALDVESD